MPVGTPPTVSLPSSSPNSRPGHPLGPGLHILMMWSDLGGMDPTKRLAQAPEAKSEQFVWELNFGILGSRMPFRRREPQFGIGVDFSSPCPSGGAGQMWLRPCRPGGRTCRFECREGHTAPHPSAPKPAVGPVTLLLAGRPFGFSVTSQGSLFKCSSPSSLPLPSPPMSAGQDPHSQPHSGMRPRPISCLSSRMEAGEMGGEVKDKICFLFNTDLGFRQYFKSGFGGRGVVVW